MVAKFAATGGSARSFACTMLHAQSNMISSRLLFLKTDVVAPAARADQPADLEHRELRDALGRGDAEPPHNIVYVAAFVGDRLEDGLFLR
jgi:hypothetical protein